MPTALTAPELLHADLGVFFAPVRHHSPACALALRDMIRELKPQQVLIEAPEDFEAVLPVLMDERLRPPVAVVAFGEAGDEGAVTSYFPFSRHAPEYVALMEARRLTAKVRFIDLPSTARLAREQAPPAASTTAPRSLTSEVSFSASDLVAAMCRRAGCRDQNELWDVLFESRIGSAGWRDLFRDIGAWCAAIRETMPPAQLAADDTPSREARMIAGLSAALSGPGPIVVVTGGLHTPALVRSLHERPPEDPVPTPEAQVGKAYVVRFGFRELDHLNGYAAGLPLPAFYDAVWDAALGSGDGGIGWRSVATTLLTGFVTRLRRERPSLTPAFPTITQTLETALRLADLRGRPGPLRTDLIDAVLNACVKGEALPGAAPILDELIVHLRGDAIGDVPPSAGAPPLVERARATALQLGFDLSKASPVRHALDVYRNDRDLARSRFLHAMDLLGTGFGRRIGGPEPLSGAGNDLLFETWTCAWSSLVEGRLIELARHGDTLEAATLGEVRRVLRDQRDRIGAVDAASVVRMLARACQAGLQAHVGELVSEIDAALAADPEIGTVARALADLLLIWRARTLLGLVGSPEVGRLLGTAYRRALQLAGDIADVKEERQAEMLRALATIRQVVVSAGADTQGVDPQLFDHFVERQLAATLPPLLAGAIAALAFLAGRIDAAELAHRINGQVAGAALDASAGAAALRGLALVSPELLAQVPEVANACDLVMRQLSEDAFVAQLPHLRLAFAALNPRETDAVARLVAERHGVAVAELNPRLHIGATEAELARAVAVEARLSQMLREDGLADWLGERTPG